jgi:hypothetical protein
MSLFLYSFIDNFENIFLPNDVVMISNYEEKKEWIKERHGGAQEQQRRPSQVGVSIQVELESNLDYRNNPYQNRRTYHISTPLWTFFIWIESQDDKLSNDADLTSKFFLSIRKTSK